MRASSGSHSRDSGWLTPRRHRLGEALPVSRVIERLANLFVIEWRHQRIGAHQEMLPAGRMDHRHVLRILLQADEVAQWRLLDQRRARLPSNWVTMRLRVLGRMLTRTLVEVRSAGLPVVRVALERQVVALAPTRTKMNGPVPTALVLASGPSSGVLVDDVEVLEEVEHGRPRLIGR